MTTNLKIDAQDWLDWKASKTTKEFFRVLEVMKREYEERMGEGKFIDMHCSDKTQLEAGAGVGYIRAINKVLELKPETEAAGEETEEES